MNEEKTNTLKRGSSNEEKQKEANVSSPLDKNDEAGSSNEKKEKQPVTSSPLGKNDEAVTATNTVEEVSAGNQEAEIQESKRINVVVTETNTSGEASEGNKEAKEADTSIQESKKSDDVVVETTIFEKAFAGNEVGQDAEPQVSKKNTPDVASTPPDRAAASSPVDKNDEATEMKTLEDVSAGDEEASEAVPQEFKKSALNVASTDQDGAAETDTVSNKKRKITEVSLPNRRRKARDAPRRPLSAYNIYFKEQRALLIARNNAGAPDDDFQKDLAAIVSKGGKKMDDPSAIFQAASRTLAARWKTMDPQEKAMYERSAEEEMRMYRARVTEYESRMVEDARQKSLERQKCLARQEEQIEQEKSTSDANTANTEARNSNAANGGGVNQPAAHAKVDAISDGLPSLPWCSAALQGMLLQQHGLQGHVGLGAFPSHQVPIYVGGNAQSALLAQLLQNQALSTNGIQGIQGLVSPTAYVTYPAQVGPSLVPTTVLGSTHSPAFQATILEWLQRENILERQFALAWAANAPVAMTIFPPGVGMNQQLVAPAPPPPPQQDRPRNSPASSSRSSSPAPRYAPPTSYYPPPT